MISVNLEHLECSQVRCSNTGCRHLPEYIYPVVENTWFIKRGTIVAIVSLGSSYETYCRDCIDLVYQIVKSKLDAKLWVFH